MRGDDSDSKVGSTIRRRVFFHYGYSGRRRSVSFGRQAGSDYDGQCDRPYEVGHYGDRLSGADRSPYDCAFAEYEDQMDGPSESYKVTDDPKDEIVEQGRPWLPPQVPGTPSKESSQDDGTIASTSRSGMQEESLKGVGAQEPCFVPIAVCRELRSLLTDGITADQ